MAKTTNKTLKKAAAGKKPKNKITLDLTKLEFDDHEKLDLLRTVRESVSTKLKNKSREKAKGFAASAKEVTISASEPATITVVIRDTETDRSDIRLEHNGVIEELSQGGDVTFENVQQGDAIWVEGHSLGTVKFTIDRVASPPKKEYRPLDIIAFDFEILE